MLSAITPKIVRLEEKFTILVTKSKKYYTNFKKHGTIQSDVTDKFFCDISNEILK